MLVCRLVFIERFVAGATRLNWLPINFGIGSSGFELFYRFLFILFSLFPFFYLWPRYFQAI